jgi:hypothetical protein
MQVRGFDNPVTFSLEERMWHRQNFTDPSAFPYYAYCLFRAGERVIPAGPDKGKVLPDSVPVIFWMSKSKPNEVIVTNGRMWKCAVNTLDKKTAVCLWKTLIDDGAEPDLYIRGKNSDVPEGTLAVKVAKISPVEARDQNLGSGWCAGGFPENLIVKGNK